MSEGGPEYYTLRGHKVIKYPPPDEFWSIEIPSSDPNKEAYGVVVDSKSVECECKAFVYRHTCRHVTTAIQLIRGELK